MGDHGHRDGPDPAKLVSDLERPSSRSAVPRLWWLVPAGTLLVAAAAVHTLTR